MYKFIIKYCWSYGLYLSIFLLLLALLPIVSMAKSTTNTDTVTSILNNTSITSSPEKNTDLFARIKEKIVPLDIKEFAKNKTVLIYNDNDTNYHPSIENINFCPKNNNSKEIISLCDLTTALKNKLSVKRQIIFEINKNKLKEYFTQLNQTIKEPGKNATFAIDQNDKIYVKNKAKYGYELDLEKLINNPLKYFTPKTNTKIITLPLKDIIPTITEDNYQQLGLKEKIGHGESNFKGSPKNRIHNIHIATNKFTGVIIPPKETFSFLKILGDVNEDAGYKEELVIKNHKTIPEFGGGVCQVSTTMFRAAINSGLKIIARHNHAYPVQYYYPQGTDATVYIPKPDLQFVNNTPGYILIQPHFEGTILSFDIFGTTDGRQVETEGPILLKRTDDGGRKYVWWQIIKDKNGKILEKNGFWSFYQNPAKFHEQPEIILSKKPKNWSGKEWKRYKNQHGM